jgi:hypothetical protein
MAPGAGIIIPPSQGPAVELSGSEFDSKVGRECRPNPVADSGRMKRNSGEPGDEFFPLRQSYASQNDAVIPIITMMQSISKH